MRWPCLLKNSTTDSRFAGSNVEESTDLNFGSFKRMAFLSGP
ncbi:hypothetical protein N9A87_00475 [Euryarchaeota archaeon]|nr:hypothetical protein [Euryarchaeota archaeon]